MKRCWGRRALSLAFALVVVAVAVGTLVPGAGRWLPFYAPLPTHFVAFALIGMLARFAMPAALYAISAALTLGLVAESMQLVVPGRIFSLLDLLANLGGAVLGTLLAGVVLVLSANMRVDETKDGKVTELE